MSSVANPLLSFYDTYDFGEVTLQDFEEAGYERFKLLKELENIKSSQKGENLNTQLAKCVFRSKVLKEQDDLSHQILRIAHCRTEEYRKWFLDQECDLFRIRLFNDRQQIKRLLEHHGINCERIEPMTLFTEIDSSVRQLADKSKVDWIIYKNNIHYDQSDCYYKVPFEMAIDLLSSKKILLNDGYAYIPENKMTSVLLRQFREGISRGLALCSQMYQEFMQDPRLSTILKGLPVQYTGRDFSKAENVGEVTLSNIQTLVQQSFPLCMRKMVQFLQTQNHLKNDGRVELTLFLKGIGLSLEDCTTFMKSYFTKRITAEKFNKEYAYTIRHLYGKEGKRANYPPYSCIKIVGTNIVQDSCNGCPYKYMDSTQLNRYLLTSGVDSKNATTIVQNAKDKNYNVACRLHFEATHPGGDSQYIGLHPNEWFQASFEYFKNKTTSAEQSSSSSTNNTPHKA
ncbi:hypothetical protein WA158_000332 [Blastocystis sp. Blastoise]